MIWDRRDRFTDDSPPVAMLRGEADEVRRERWQVNGLMLAAIAIVAWHFEGQVFAPLPLLALVVVALLCAIHNQICGPRLDAIYREIRAQSPELWQES